VLVNLDFRCHLGVYEATIKIVAEEMSISHSDSKRNNQSCSRGFIVGTLALQWLKQRLDSHLPVEETLKPNHVPVAEVGHPGGLCAGPAFVLPKLWKIDLGYMLRQAITRQSTNQTMALFQLLVRLRLKAPTNAEFCIGF
jgi:hypothetical protein